MESWQEGLARAIGSREDELTQELGVSRQTVWRWKAGERWPEPGMVLRLCRALEVTPDQIYGFRPLPERRPTRRQLDEAVALVDQLRAILAPAPETLGNPEETPEDYVAAEKDFDAIEEARREVVRGGEVANGRTRQGGRQ